MEAIFAKLKPEAEKPRMVFGGNSLDDGERDDDDEDFEVEDDYNKPDEDDVEIGEPDDDEITEDNYSTMMDLGSDPDEEVEGLAVYSED